LHLYYYSHPALYIPSFILYNAIVNRNTERRNEEETKMMNWMNMNNMANVLAEDVYAPELRNPLNSGMTGNRKQDAKKTGGWLSRLFGQKR